MSNMQPVFRVVWPLGRTRTEASLVSSPLADLNGKTVCEVWDRQFRGDEVFAVVKERLRRRYPGVKFVGHEAFGNTHGPDEREVLAALPGRLVEHGCDLAISGMGA
ncbi:MAG: hypothetical protein HYX92_22280 [Chloroflexi bacterium]|nr:hypothetical protein [Chloroflexota bacterium]